MIALYVVSFLLGLVLCVRSMLTGVEKPQHGVAPGSESGSELSLAAPAVRIRTPTLAAFATVFGILGYFLERSGALGPPLVRLIVAALAGGIAVALTLVVLARWARPALAGSQEDPRYVLQGFPARVSRAITAASTGEITFEVDGRTVVSPAVGFEGGEHAVGEEVVIDRIEEGVAFVEAWSLVEQRL